MPNSVQTRPLYDETVGDQTRVNMEEIYKKFSSIFSNNNLGLNDKTVTSNTTLNNEDGVVFVNTSGGNITITLPYANSWGSNKTPVLVVVKTSESNLLTITTQGSDTLSYWTQNQLIVGAFYSKGATILVSDGASKWFSLADEVDVEFPYTRTITGATTLNLLDRIVVCDSSAANYNVTLPLANSSNGLGQIIHIQRNSSGVLITATIIPQGADSLVVDSTQTAALGVGRGCTVVSNGSNQWLLH